MVNVIVHCPRCQSAQIYRHEVSSKGRERFRDCHRVFILIYTYESRKPSVKNTKIVFNGTGVRNTARTLKTVLTPSFAL